ncbi:MAG TPA: hypothetical protein VGC97_01060 [Pyrinomonadaceae bacterium]
MRKITNTQTNDLSNPKLRQIAADLSNEVCLAMEKALANYSEPSVYPISDNRKSLEQICRTYFRSVNPAKQQEMAKKAITAINAPKKQRSQKYGELAEIDLRSKTPIEDQAQRLVPRELQITENDLRRDNGHSPLHISHRDSHESERSIRSSDAVGTAAQQLTRLVFRIKRVECKEQTGEWGEDEIFLGGTAIDERGNVQKINQFKVGDFEKGDVWNPSGPRPFASFELSKRGIGYPRTYSVVLVLVEEDAGNLTEFLNRLANIVRDKLKEKLSSIPIEYLGLFLGTIVGEVMGWFVDNVFEYLSSLWGDEIFLPATNLIPLPSPDFRWDSGTKSRVSSLIAWEFNGFDGQYWVDCDWELFAAKEVVA